MFNLDLIDLPVLERLDGEIRQYRTPEGLLYPSVTTVLGAAADKSGLDAWRKAVGEEEANRVSARAARRGTAVHSLCERLVLNEDVNTRSEMPVNVHMYRQLERELRAHCDDIRGSELFLYSDALKVAGACDLIASWDGVPSIIDFKTSGKNKRKDWIEGYFLQCSLYAYMFWERTGILHSQIVVLIAVEEENEAQIFVENATNYLKKAKQVCKQFHSK